MVQAGLATISSEAMDRLVHPEEQLMYAVGVKVPALLKGTWAYTEVAVKPPMVVTTPLPKKMVEV